jgi:hypothetical protein
MANKKNNRISLPSYWESIRKSIDAKFRLAKTFLNHPVQGNAAEGFFRDLIRTYIPSRYTVDSGFVVDSDGNRSANMDIIIADTHNIPLLCSEPSFKIFPVESVCAAIEVTTAPKGYVNKKPKLLSDLEKLIKIRKMGEERTYVVFSNHVSEEELKIKPQSMTLNLCPRTFLITSGREWTKRETYSGNIIKHLKSLKVDCKQTWLNACFSLNHGMLWFKPYTDFEYKWEKKDALMMFLFSLVDSVTSFQTYRIELRKYTLTPEI